MCGGPADSVYVGLGSWWKVKVDHILHSLEVNSPADSVLSVPLPLSPLPAPLPPSCPVGHSHLVSRYDVIIYTPIEFLHGMTPVDEQQWGS